MTTEFSTRTFAAASKDFQTFLAKESASSELVWIFREDVVSRKGRLLVKEPIPRGNTDIVEALFQSGWKRGHGVALDVLCLLGSRHCGYIWLPENDRDAELHMVAGLKMSVPTKLQVASSVRSWFKWQLYKWLDEKSYWVENLPRRKI
jgi:hypothetical protein